MGSPGRHDAGLFSFFPLLLAFLAAALFLGPAAPGLRADPGVSKAPAPQQLIEKRRLRVKAFVEKLGDPVPDAKREELKGILSEMVDYDLMARRTLGKHWDSISEAQRKEFTGLLKSIIEGYSTQKLSVYKHSGMEYDDDEIRGDEAVVTSFFFAKGEERSMEYKLRRTKDGWLIWDFVIDGADLVQVYREDFNKIITQNSFEELLRRMRDRATKTVELPQ